MQKTLFLNGFYLKLIAIITMTLDHIGLFLMSYAFENQIMLNTGYAFRIIGRLALPLFCFLCVEGALHTKNIKKYILRLGLCASVIFSFQFLMHMLFLGNVVGSNMLFKQPNIFLTLMLGVIMIAAFQNKNKIIKSLGILPILYCILSFLITCYEFKFKAEVYWLIYFIRPDYSILAIFIILMFYLSYKILPLIYSYNNLNADFYKDTNHYRFYLNCLSFAGLFIVSLAFYAITYIDYTYVYWDSNVQLLAIIAGIFILFYNGKRGYDSTPFRIFAYTYYPLHLIIIYLIFFLIFQF